jgi:YjbE family integral membrane protein
MPTQAMTGLVASDALVAFLQVLMIDLVLAGDNAVVIGLAAAGLPREQQRRAILIGIAAATVLRLIFAAIATQLLQVLGLLLAGGLLLFWVCWKMWRELRSERANDPTSSALHRPGHPGEGALVDGHAPQKTLRQATLQIVLADVSMSLDNVLAVAGAAREHPVVLVFGLVLSIALMGVAASLLGRVLQKHRWIAYAGLAIILYVAGEMVVRGVQELQPVFQAVNGAVN